MNIDKYIINYFNSDDYILIPLDKGYTNYNYLLTINNNKYVVRVPKKDSSNIVFREHEYIAEQAIKDKDVSVSLVNFDLNSGIKITKYIDDCKEFNENTNNKSIKMIAKKLKYLHSLKIDAKYDFNPIGRLNKYRSHTNSFLYDLSSYLDIIEDVKNLKYDPVLCHNDLVSGNILFKDDIVYIIDFEYAANNDPIFDVMSFISENDINDQELRNIFYKEYFNELNDEIQHSLLVWEVFHNLLWCSWAMMMYDNRRDTIYKDIANNKYNALKKSYNTYKKRK